MKKILVIDDDPDLVKLLQVGLEKRGFEVLSAMQGSEGLRVAFHAEPDLVILDIVMPEIDGWETCQRLREWSDVPIIMLTASTRDADVVKGLALGADDYVTKPFSVAELIARTEACLRRAGSANSRVTSAILVGSDLMIDFDRRMVTVRGEQVDLTPPEFRLLSYLARNRGRVVNHRALLSAVWGPEYGDELDYLRLHVSCLRRKIEEDPAHPQIVKTAWGEGYYLE